MSGVPWVRGVRMTSYFIRRLLLVIPTFVGVTMLVFCLTRLVPGGPIERALNEALLAGGDRGSAITQSVGAGESVLSEAQLDQ